MAKIIRQQRMDYGGVCVWCKGDDQPVYLADGRIDQKRIDAVLAERAIFGNSRYGLITNMRVVMLLGGFCSIVAAGVVVHWLASLVNG